LNTEQYSSQIRESVPALAHLQFKVPSRPHLLQAFGQFELEIGQISQAKTVLETKVVPERIVAAGGTRRVGVVV
jgi:hypothetical protein